MRRNRRSTLAVTAAAVGAASGAFSFLNSGGPSEIVSAFIGGAVGRSLRSLLFRYRYNQYAVTTLCAAIASGVYVLVAHALARAGLPVSPHAAGFISSALFLVPGFPLIAGLLDLVQHQIVAGITRLTYALMVLTAAAFGLCLVASAASLSISPPPPPQFDELSLLGLRAPAKRGAIVAARTAHCAHRAGNHHYGARYLRVPNRRAAR